MEREIVGHRHCEGGRRKTGLGNLTGRGEGEKGELNNIKVVFKNIQKQYF